MKEVNKTSLARMGKLNNSIVQSIGGSECTPIEVITVLRTITNRLDKAFELSVMGNPVSSIAERISDGSNVE